MIYAVTKDISPIVLAVLLPYNETEPDAELIL